MAAINVDCAFISHIYEQFQGGKRWFWHLKKQPRMIKT